MKNPSELIDVAQLRVGMFVELELGWMAHPFPTSSFKISNEKQIETIRGLGRSKVRYVPGKSDAISFEGDPKGAPENQQTPGDSHLPDNSLLLERQKRSQSLETQQRELAACERRFDETVRLYRQVVDEIPNQPKVVLTRCRELVGSYVGEMLSEGDSAIRLLSDGMGDKLALHPINVSVIALLLGKYLQLPEADMTDLGLAAFLHDVGKSQIPDRVRWMDESFSSVETRAYREHVAQGVLLGQRMDLPAAALQAISQHHEMVDGSGFPAHIKGESMSRLGKILSLVNFYENLCNPSRPTSALTPHEAIALIFAQLKSRFDPQVLAAFIRMMGVYPPGSVVQLSDERYAMVVSVNSSRPLKPRIIVFDPAVPKTEALILDLETVPSLGIRRSLKPASLPRAAIDYLSPRQRICYFFERAVETPCKDSAA
jgi:HD-GYP domain-containing protein (c-di-GMP phosphodiesterase class II)